ncbi:hypothetical protein [Thalassotalea sp. G20_0]|uniref:hypothetical protein n=1 Tax=Thalassotalea sp. G20_0 TaxID=2821093 RepID=UPI001AD9D4B0|nr:hypothetical protein [Thalassotalea sp. G20_0]
MTAMSGKAAHSQTQKWQHNHNEQPFHSKFTQTGDYIGMAGKNDHLAPSLTGFLPGFFH